MFQAAQTGRAVRDPRTGRLIDPNTGQPMPEIMADPAMQAVEALKQPKERRPNYSGSIPQIAQAYTNDPTTRLAESALASGGSTAPVAQGGWAVTDGLARAAQAVLGAYLTKKQGKKYGEREQEYVDALKASAALAGEVAPQEAAQTAFSNPAQPAPVAQTAAAALAPATVGAGGGTQGFGSPNPAPMPPPPVPALQGPPQGKTGRVLAPGQSARAPGFQGVAVNIANKYGLNPVDVAAVMSYETAGSFSPTKMGGKGGRYMGLIQFGPEERRTFGINRKSGPEDWERAIDGFFQQRGFKPGMSTLDLYSTINAGRPGKYDASDGNGTVRSHHDKIMREHRASAANWLQTGGVSVGAESSYNANENVSAPGQTNIPAPAMEAVPGRPEMPLNAPNAPALPKPVQSQRLAMAKQMLESGNPDLAVMAQAYLDKGLDENFDSAATQNSQAFQQGQAGYSAAMQDFTGARSDARQNNYGERRDAVSRNFNREERYGNQTFQAAESAAERKLRAAEASADRAASRSNIEYDNNRDDMREASKAQSRPRNPWLDTATGVKAQNESMQRVLKIDEGIERAKRFMEINEKQKTGGVYGLPGIGSAIGAAASAFDDDLGEMGATGNQMVLDMMPNGSLGAQVSNSDRDFVQKASPGIGTRSGVNKNIASMYIAASKRQKDFELEKFEAFSNQTTTQFIRNWSDYVAANPFVKYDKDRRARIVDNPVTYREWNSRARYDRNGKPM